MKLKTPAFEPVSNKVKTKKIRITKRNHRRNLLFSIAHSPSATERDKFINKAKEFELLMDTARLAESVAPPISPLKKTLSTIS